MTSLSDPRGPQRLAQPRPRGGLRSRLVVGFGSVSVATAVLTAFATLLVFIALESYHPLWVTDLAHFVFGVTPRISDTDAAIVLLLAAALLILLTVGLAQLVARRVLKPVGQLAEAADRVAAGDLDVQLEPEGRDELAMLVANFNTMTAQVRASVDELRRRETQARRFASDVSHELRSPLAAMTAVTEVLKSHTDGREDDEARATRLVVAGVGRLGRLVEDLIEVSRFDAGTATLQRDTITVATAVRGCLEVRGWGERVSVQVPDDLSFSGDRRRFDVIVSNLAGNALRHGRPPVELTAAAHDGQLRLSVRDHGPGIPPEVLPVVFDRFFKADSARSPSEGSGLGLAIAQENARLHGGEIAAANADPDGAIFTLILPLAP